MSIEETKLKAGIKYLGLDYRNNVVVIVSGGRMVRGELVKTGARKGGSHKRRGT